MIPIELLEALERGELIVCAGPQLGLAAGLPSMTELAHRLLADAKAHGRSLDETTIREWIDAGRTEEALEALERRLGPRFQRVVERELSQLHRPIPPLAYSIAALEPRLRAVYTTGLDRLLERAFADVWPSFSTAQLDLTRRRKLIVKLCGTLEFPETWVLTRAARQREFDERSARGQLLAVAYRSHCLLFVGFDPRDALSERLFSLGGLAEPGEPLPTHFVVLDQCTGEQRAQIESRGFVVLTGGAQALLDALAGGHRERDAGDQPLPRCPYPGLQPFDHELSAVFHGRCSEISAAAARLGGPGKRHRRWLAIDGSSGVGKSSFVHAGLVPALRRGFAEGTPTRWRVASLRPGRRPLYALVDALATALASEAESARLQATDSQTPVLDAPSSVAVFVREHVPPGTALLLVIDQLEELVTSSASGERSSFAACLSILLEQQLVYVVTTLRSDFTAALTTTIPALGRLLNEHAERYTLAPISRVGLRVAIAEPALQVGVRFDGQLVERIASDAEQHLDRGRTDEDGIVRTDDAALPLVAHVLRGLWDAGAADDGEISLAEYEALGGVSGALSRSADALLATLDVQQRGRTKQLLMAMVNLDGGRLTRRTLSRLEAQTLAGGDHGGEQLLQLLSGATGPRIIVIRHESAEILVDLVHEALLREWDTLRGWIAADRAQLARDESLARRTAAWIDQAKPWRSLPRGPERRELLRGRPHGKSASEQREYQRAMRTALRVRVSAWLGASAVVIALVDRGRSELLDAQTDRERTAIELGEAQAQQQVTAGQLDREQQTNQHNERRAAIRRLLDQQQCRAALDKLLRELPDELELLQEVARCEVIVGELGRLVGADIEAVAVDEHAREAWIGRSDGAVQRWSLDTRQLLDVTTISGTVDDIRVSSRRDRVAVRSGGQVWLFDRRGRPIGSVFDGAMVEFSPDGLMLLTTKKRGTKLALRTSVDGSLVWELITGGKFIALDHPRRAGRLIVGDASEANSTISSIDMQSGEFIGAPIHVPGYLRDLAVSPDGELVASIADDNRTRLWSLATGEPASPPLTVAVQQPKDHARVWFSPDGNSLATTSTDTQLAIVDVNLKASTQIADLELEVTPRFSPGSAWLLAADAGHHAVLHALASGRDVARFDLESPAVSLHYTPSTRSGLADIVTHTSAGAVIHWVVDSQRHWQDPIPHEGMVRSLRFSVDDEHELYSGSTVGNVHAWHIGDPSPPREHELSGSILALASGDSQRPNLALSTSGLLRWDEQGPLGAAPSETLCGSKIATFSASGDRLAVACSSARDVQIWALTGARPQLLAIASTQSDVASLAWSPTGDRLALGTSDGAIELLELDATGVTDRAQLPSEHEGTVTSLDFGDSGRTLVSGGNDNLVRVWALDSRLAKPLELTMRGYNVESVALSASAEWIAAGDERGVIMVWNRDGVVQRQFALDCSGHAVTALEFSPHGDWLAAGCADGNVLATPISPEALLELACRRLANTTTSSSFLPPTCRDD
ncbi:MAG TPA: SIR2 family protein [Enhygromyxa sp.]|nr:SIR2 family protein [Enhygromyxa sp.]